MEDVTNVLGFVEKNISKVMNINESGALLYEY